MIAGRFRSQILDGSRPAGDRLPRQEVLARELGVSLVVVREALRMLEAQGLITVHRGKTVGATVRIPELPDEPTLLSFIVAAAMVIDLPDRQALLTEPDAAGRLNAERAMLSRETSMLRTTTSRPAPDLRNTPYNPN